jgi:hypothetical protein
VARIVCAPRPASPDLAEPQNADPTRASGTSITGIGIAAAADIAYPGFTALPSTASFCAARASTIVSAGTFAANVADAWDEGAWTRRAVPAGAADPRQRRR